MTDYIIVGCGLGGIAFAETALAHGKSIIVFDNNSQTSSTIAAGLYNPVILKRFSKLHHAQMQLDMLADFYRTVENKLNIKINFQKSIFRRFFSVEEQNNWFELADKHEMSDFLSSHIITNSYGRIYSPFGYGQVLQTGYIDTGILMKQYKTHLTECNAIVEAAFDYDAVQFHDGKALYDNLTARHIIFAEGFGMHANPFFSYLPLDGTKGELLIINAPGLQLDTIINSSIYIVPLGQHFYKVGATYDWTDKTNAPTEAGKAELTQKLKEILKCDFDIVGHSAGVRPTVRDRKPLLGTHPEHPNLHILNGLGTRGVMLGPYAAKILFDYIENGIPIDRENNISRFAV